MRCQREQSICLKVEAERDRLRAATVALNSVVDNRERVIDDLRAEVESLKVLGKGLIKTKETLEAEVERLRETLRTVAKWKLGVSPLTSYGIAELARVALKS